MNKLLKTTLIVAVLSTGAMASTSTGALPKTIESGATVYVNMSMGVGTGDHVYIDNYGSIDTEVTSEPYPQLTTAHGYTINNHVGKAIQEETDETKATAIKTANPARDVNKVYKVVDEGGYFNPNI